MSSMNQGDADALISNYQDASSEIDGAIDYLIAAQNRYVRAGGEDASANIEKILEMIKNFQSDKLSLKVWSDDLKAIAYPQDEDEE